MIVSVGRRSSGQGRGARRFIAGCVATGLAALTSMPGVCRADAGGPILDPYPPAPAAGPLDPYATPAPPPYPQVAPYAPSPYPPPATYPTAPGYGTPIDPYRPGPPPTLPPPSLPAAPNLECCVEPAPAPISYRPVAPTQTELRPRYGLMAAGIAMFAGVWAITTASGVLSDRNELAIPIAGPIITAVDLHDQYRSGPGLTMATTALVVDAMLQATGVILAIAGGASRVRVTKRTPAATAPTVTPYGAGLSGRF